MDPRSNSNSGLGLPQPGSDMGQLPPIHTPQSFHAPDTAATHFDTAAPQIGAMAPAAQQFTSPPPMAPPANPTTPVIAQPDPQPLPTAAMVPNEHQTGQLAAAEAEAGSQMSIAPAEDTDTAFDEEWVNKAREISARTQNDPYLQSQELGRLKAQYIKLRYNKDVKVEE
jgi:hypothetical protein